MRKAFFSLLLTSLVGIKPYACNHSVLGGQVTNLPSQCILIRLIKYLIYGAKPMSDYSCNFATNKQFNHIRMKKKNIQTPVLSMAIAACMISHQQNAWGREKPSLQNDSVPYVTMPDGEVIASIKVGTLQMKLIESQLQKNMTGTMDLCFVLKGNNITFDEWKFK